MRVQELKSSFLKKKKKSSEDIFWTFIEIGSGKLDIKSGAVERSEAELPIWQLLAY